MAERNEADGGAGRQGGALWTVGEVAERAHVSVRALHHYDEIGLLSPSSRTDAGYRLYGPRELERLHQVLLFRELGLGLESIGRLLDGPPSERRAALEAQRRELERRRRRTEAVIRAVDRAIETLERGEPMESTELFDGFGEFDHARHAEEAEARWGDTEAYRESSRRTKRYGKEDWAAIQAEADGIMERMASLMAEGADATSEPAMDLAEEHRRHIDRWFYPCPPRMHAGLADMYQADERFGAYFEERGAGLTAFASDAIRANAERAAADDGA
jgi:DNA-binding transcriptional MerR regulator